MSEDKRPVLGISMGDPGGIGPEITAKALNEKNIYELARPLVVGDCRVMEDVLRFTDLKLTLNPVRKVQAARGEHGAMDILDLKNMPLDRLKYKEVTAEQARTDHDQTDNEEADPQSARSKRSRQEDFCRSERNLEHNKAGM